MNENSLIVQGQGQENSYKSKLGMSCVIRSSFILQWEKNSTYQIQFTAIDDGKTGYDLLTPEASLFFMGQEFLIKQIAPDYNIGFNTKAITATHIYSECQWFRKDEVKNGVLTYTPQSIMSYVFDGNPAGFTYEVIGEFSSSQIENFGNVSGQEALAKIIEVWPDAIIFPDNKHIKIYQHDSFVKNLGHRLSYLHNSSEVKLTYDSTNISNQVWCIGKAKDKAEGVPNDAPTEYYFPPFMVTDENSVQKWTKGIPHRLPAISDERFTKADDMEQFALKQFQLDPALTVEVTKTTSEQPIPGEMVRLEIKQDDLATDIEVVGFSYYPFDSSQPTQVTLNNTAKTIFDYQNSLRNKVYKDLISNQARTNSLLNNLSKTIAKVNNDVSNLDHNIFNKKLITLGDSITEGFNGQFVDKNNAYPTKLKEILSLKEVFNVGHGGGRIDGDRDSDLLKVVSFKGNDFSSFNLVTIAYGTNDWSDTDRPLNEICAALNTAIGIIKNSNNFIRIFGILPLTRYSGDHVQYDDSKAGGYTFNQLNDGLAQVYQANNIPFLDWRADNPRVINDSNHNQKLAYDGLHPNAEGQALIASRIADFLRSNY